MRRVLAVLTLLGTTLPASAAAPPVAPPVALGETGQPITLGSGYDFVSRELGDTRRINILLPDEYDDPKQAGRRYPVLYLLDGGSGWQDFAHIAAMVQQGSRWGGGNVPLIVVGIESKDRKAEFTRPSADAAERRDFPTHGRAETFHRFLAGELKPAIAARFRTSNEDGLMGETLAGLFVVEEALRHPGAFLHHIAISPSLWWDGGRLSREAETLLKARPGVRQRLWLAMADEGGAMQLALDRLVSSLAKHAPAGFHWRHTPYPAETHATIYHVAATRAVRDEFPAAAAP